MTLTKSLIGVEQPKATDQGGTFQLAGVPVSLIGQAGAWFTLDRQNDSVVIQPNGALPRRCTIRVAALFHQDRGFPEANTVMGRVAFPNGAAEGQIYRPFTHDPGRQLRELYFPVEAMPDDEWIGSSQRWKNSQAIAKRLLSALELPWNGLSSRDIEELVTFVHYPEPLEGCVLNALAQSFHARGEAIIEIGSYQGRSISMLALALRAADGEAMLISVDPHADHPHNREQVRLALRQIGEESRLVQFTCPSDRACKMLARGTAGLVFIDGDHGYEQVAADFRNYREFVAPGGCLAFHDHDYSDHNGLPALHPGVRRAIEEHVLPSGEFRPLLLCHTLFAFIKQPATDL